MANLEREISGYHGGNRIIRRTSEEAARIFTKRKFSPGSLANLDKAVTLWESGKETWVTSNHESDADGPLASLSLREGGHPEVSEAMFILMGDKILRKWLRGLVASSYHHVIVPQPGSGNGQTRELLHTASMAIPRLFEEGMVAFTFPEGTRSRDGKLHHATPVLGHFIGDEAVVLPMALDGARELWPVEGRPNPGREITFHFGKPILISEVLEEIDCFEETTGTKVTKNKKNEIIVDTIMRRGIAPLLPFDERGDYSNSLVSIKDLMKNGNHKG